MNTNTAQYSLKTLGSMSRKDRMRLPLRYRLGIGLTRVSSKIANWLIKS